MEMIVLSVVLDKENYHASGNEHVVSRLEKENYYASGSDHVVSWLNR
jgi:hypothetical protein